MASIVIFAKRSLLILLALSATMGRVAQAEEQSYVLQIGDEVKITVFKEPDISGSYKVGANGFVSVPGVGEIKTAGLTPTQLRDVSKQALSDLHHANPSITVEVVQYSPVYIMGDVRNPGRQLYTPGLTVLQLIALAGGYPPPLGTTEGDSTAQEVEKQKLDLAVYREKYASQSIKRARLLAERDGKASFDTPAELEAMIGKDRLEQIKASEMHLKRSRVFEEEQRVRLLRRQAEEVVKGRAALEEQLEATKRLKVIIDSELRNIRDLKERGLTASTRVLELERISADTEMRINSGISMISQASQSLAGIDLLIRQTSEAARVKIAEQLVDTETELVVINRQLISAVELLNMRGISTPGSLTGQGEVRRRLSIVRKNKPEPILASENMQISPSDVLIVERVMEASTKNDVLATGSSSLAETAFLPQESNVAGNSSSPGRR
ncbi:polysaccharide biosynthesis/export family protein [Microvirga terrestris]|uniref:Polysaccharide biosynthesis/export family protein n=1 Tax=Microvirga terrestris TaxID=2791024 RepID=A0ABS0HVN7_9HYPH|nr:polysaccharide biosynthesis/export family protein [Microvirga terrestris]MBF9197542.1 polysaccharide biosynthesis/export family protein [Microvirga terrestris]